MRRHGDSTAARAQSEKGSQTFELDSVADGTPETYTLEGLCCQRMSTDDSPPDLLVIFLPGIDADVQHNTHFHKLTATLLPSIPNTVVTGIEYPGHGRSAGEMGVLPPAKVFVALILAVVEAIVKREQATKVIFAGHSMGGLLALLLTDHFSALDEGACTRDTLVGAVLLAPALDTMVDSSFACCTCACAACACCCAGRHGCSLLAPPWCGIRQLLNCLVLSCGCTGLLPKEGTHDPDLPPEEMAATLRSRCVERMRAEACVTLLDLMDIVQRKHWKVNAAATQVPLLVVQGTLDKNVPAQSIASFAKHRQLDITQTSGLGRHKSSSAPSAAVLPTESALTPRSLRMSEQMLLLVAGAKHRVLAGAVAWRCGKDVTDELILPVIRRWVAARTGLEL